MTRALMLALLVALTAPAVASAQPSTAPEGAEAETEAEAVDPEDSHETVISERRARPDYDQRDDAGPDAGEVLLWFPRILFGPITIVLDYGIRRPIGLLAETAERGNWLGGLLDVFTWNGRRSGLVPTFFLANGLQPWVGLVFFANDDIAPGHAINASVSFGGVDFIEGGLSYSVRHNPGFLLEISGSGGTRPDRIFSGVGWNAQQVQFRFRENWYDADLRLRADFWRQSTLMVSTGVDGHEFDANGYAALAVNSPPLSEAVAQGVIEEPYGLRAPYVVTRQHAEIALDSREIEPAPGHGFRIDGSVEHATDLNDPLGRRWLRWGGSLGGFLDVGHHRVLGLWAIVRFADPLGHQAVPFTELVALGQESLLMQGFLRGQLRGRSAAAATLEYLYPIWTWLDARLHVSVGNTFDTHLSDFALERLRLSFGFGFATANDPNDALQVTIAAGTAPFVEGAAIQSFQLVVGSRRGF